MTAAKPRKVAVVLTALAVETKAVLRHLEGVHSKSVSATDFFVGTFQDWDMAVAEVGPGNPATAAIATRACDHFNPQIALFVGVAGGIKDVKLGDVVVATKAYGYESGRDAKEGF